MRRISLKEGKNLRQEDEIELDHLVETIHQGRYFKRISEEMLKNMIQDGELVYLQKNEFLIHEKDQDVNEMFILIKGSLAIISNSVFILRLQFPGDVVGEAAVFGPTPRLADVIAEEDCELLSLSVGMFHINNKATTAPIIYVLIAHVLAEKLRVTTALSSFQKRQRPKTEQSVNIAIIDNDELDRDIFKGVLEKYWSEAEIVEYVTGEDFLNDPLEHQYTLIIVDILSFHKGEIKEDEIRYAFSKMQLHGSPVFVISKYCENDLNRDFIREQGAEEMLLKPFAINDLIHRIEKFRMQHYKRLELEQIEHDADTDQLTRVANRRRMDDFIETLVTLYPEKLKGFSFIMLDIDHFKHYNDTNGHQMGDQVLTKFASILSNKIRRGDLVARYGGEEFAVILPNCSLENAVIVAEKIRFAVEQHHFANQEKQPSGNFTATLGVSSFPPALQVDELIKQADSCLYHGKAAGRNVVIKYEPSP